MGSPLLARLRLRGARVDPLPDRGPLKAELPLPDPGDRDQAAVYEFVNPGRPQVEIGRDLERSPHTMHSDEDASPRDNRSSVGFAGALLRRDGGQEAECLEGVTRVERTSGLTGQRRLPGRRGQEHTAPYLYRHENAGLVGRKDLHEGRRIRNTRPPTYYWHENAGLWDAKTCMKDAGSGITAPQS